MFYRIPKFRQITFFLIFILSFTLYFLNYFVHQQSRDRRNFKETKILFQKFWNSSLDNYNQKNKLIFLIPNENTVKEANMIFGLHNGDCKKLFSILKINNVILLDIDILKNLIILSNLSNIKRVSKFQKLKESSLITFGVNPNYFFQLNEVFILLF